MQMNQEQLIEQNFPLMLLGLFFLAGIVIDIVLIIQFIARRNEWKGLSSTFSDRPWNHIDIGYLLIAALLPITAIHTATYLAITYETATIADIEAPVIILQTALTHGLVLLIAWRLFRMKGISSNEAFGIKSAGIAQNTSSGLMSYLAILPPVAVGAFITAYFIKKFNIEAPMQYPLKLLTGDYPFALKAFIVFAACISAPIVEEIFFRGVAMPFIARKTGTFASVIIVSLVFASIHMNLPSFLPIFFLSIGLSLAYILSGSLLTSIVMHSLFNTITLLVVLTIKNPEQFLLK